MIKIKIFVKEILKIFKEIQTMDNWLHKQNFTHINMTDAELHHYRMMFQSRLGYKALSLSAFEVLKLLQKEKGVIIKGKLKKKLN